MQLSLCCTCELKMPKQVGCKPLSKELLLQMDNYVKDNKNQHLLEFLPLLTMREPFEEVYWDFS